MIVPQCSRVSYIIIVSRSHIFPSESFQYSVMLSPFHWDESNRIKDYQVINLTTPSQGYQLTSTLSSELSRSTLTPFASSLPFLSLPLAVNTELQVLTTGSDE